VQHPRSSGEDPAWVVLDVAPDQLTAELWLALLKEHDIHGMLNPADVSSFMGLSPGPVRVMVPEQVAQIAGRVLMTRDDIVMPLHLDNAAPEGNGQG
jgi:hypothetical protein